MGVERFVWATQFITDPKYVFGLLPENQEGPDPFDLADAYRENLPLPVDRIPRFYSVEKGRRSPKIDLFTGMNFTLFVSARMADLWEEFDLGPAPTADDPAPRRTELHRMPLYAEDQETKVADVALMQISTRKDCFLPEESQIRKYIEHRDLYMATPMTNSLAVSMSALEGPDLWHDRRLSGVFFASDRLHHAMNKAGMKPKYTFSRVRVLDR